MLKSKKIFKNNFKKLYQKKKLFTPSNNIVISKSRINKINKKKIILILKKFKKFIKKKKFFFYVNLTTNLISSYKSKNARMGNGKGQLSKKIIKHDSIDLFKVYTCKSKLIFFKKYLMAKKIIKKC